MLRRRNASHMSVLPYLSCRVPEIPPSSLRVVLGGRRLHPKLPLLHFPPGCTNIELPIFKPFVLFSRPIITHNRHSFECKITLNMSLPRVGFFVSLSNSDSRLAGVPMASPTLVPRFGGQSYRKHITAYPSLRLLCHLYGVISSKSFRLIVVRLFASLISE